MKTVVQPIKGGPVEVLDVPRPVPAADRGAGAHGRLGDLAGHRAGRHRAGPVQPAGQGPRPAGPGPPGGAQGPGGRAGRHGQAVRGRLAEDLPLGYSAAGEVVEVGSAVTGIRAGQLVATGGAGQGQPCASSRRCPGCCAR